MVGGYVDLYIMNMHLFVFILQFILQSLHIFLSFLSALLFILQLLLEFTYLDFKLGGKRGECKSLKMIREDETCPFCVFNKEIYIYLFFVKIWICDLEKSNNAKIHYFSIMAKIHYLSDAMLHQTNNVSTCIYTLLLQQHLQHPRVQM